MPCCAKCGIESDRLFLCRDNREQWYQCGDRTVCDQRARTQKAEKDLLERSQREQRFKDQFPLIDKHDLIRIGVLYKNAKTYYYHKASDTLYGESMIDHEFHRHDEPISAYERVKIEQALAAAAQ